MPVIPAIQEAVISWMMVRTQPVQMVLKTLSRKNPSQKKGWWSASGVDSEFQAQYRQKKKKKKR
jgi:hypothetical protein